MDKPKRVAWTPFTIIAGAKFEHPVIQAYFKADLRRDRKVNLLEWAILAPLVKIKPSPSVSEIATRLGVGDETFLMEAAKQLEDIGALQRTTPGFYRVTDKGRGMFEKGRILGDPRIVEDSILFDPGTKEWYAGSRIFKNNRDIGEEWVAGVEEPPLGIIYNHLKNCKILEKGEQVYSNATTACAQIKLQVIGDILLIPGKVIFRSSDTPVGDDHRSTLDKSVLKVARENGALQQAILSLRRDAEPRLSWRQTYSSELPDDCQLQHAGNVNLGDYLRGAQWCALFGEAWSILMQHPSLLPKTVFVPSKTPEGDKGVTRNDVQIIHLDLQQPGRVILATDKQVISALSLQDEGLGVPVFAEQGIEAADSIKKEIAMSMSRLPMNKGLAQALLVINPSESNLPRCLEAISASAPSNDEFDDIIRLLIKMEPSRGAAEMSKAELAIWERYMNMANWDSLIALPERVVKGNSNLYLSSIEMKRPKEQSKFDARMAAQVEVLEKRGAIFASSPLWDRYVQLIVSLRAGSILGLTSRDNIKWGPKVVEQLSKIQSPDQRMLLASKACEVISEVEVSGKEAQEALKLCVQMHRLGAEVDKLSLTNIIKRIFEEPLDILDPETRVVVRSIHEALTGMGVQIDLSSLVSPPRELPKPLNERQLSTMMNNLEELNRAGMMPDAILSNHLTQLSRSLSPKDDRDVELWLSFIISARRSALTERVKITDSDIVSVFDTSVREPKRFEKNLRTLGVWDKIVANKMDANKNPVSGIRVVVDGSNIARYNENDGSVSVENVIRTFEALLGKYSCDEVFIVIGSSIQSTLTKDKAGKKKFEALKRYFSNERKKYLIQAPSGQNDDHHVIQMALDKNMYILSNDLYRDHFREHPDMATKVASRLIKYSIVDGEVIIPQLGDFSKIGGRT